MQQKNAGNANFFCSFNLPSASNIVTSVNTTVSVKGDGKTLGMTNGSHNVGLNSYNSGSLRCYTGLYGKNIGTNDSGSVIDARPAMGVTTDATKSGLTGALTRSVFSVKFIIKY